MSLQTSFFPCSMNVTGTAYAALAQWLSNSLLACGLVRVASSKPAVAGGGNQAADYTGATPPGTINTDADWEIWRFADTLQATSPFFFKFQWRVASSTSTPALKFSVGTGLDGVSAVNGNTFAEQTLICGSVSSTAYLCAVSADTNRVAVALWAAPDATTNLYVIFGVERTHNADGSDNDEGAFVLCEYGQTTGTHPNRVISRVSFGASGQAETKYPALMPKTNTTIYGGECAVGLVFPMRGKALFPSRNWIVVNKNDLGLGGNLTFDHYYGVSQKWLNCCRGQTLPYDASNSISHALMMRFD
jgi:hypothetical protein